ncbi:(2Fe-2S)-binding protein [Romboutsia sp. 1001216sp1]|uniref:(2Fe-2S)-binding protein n=1 Tax=Romboutsia TaxID=1501226 RepID=UPI000B80A592|nr:MULTISPECIES: (2Fe-2S)-binding protein [Romboutsia]MDB8790310.1 (2Fe-2S)-binding protein [Romboutsia sp. 1001216sp1]MDB8792256.1 (2Fe-2S)-binding protein [Romboutsia sp. 1001216sp1]MDB8795550.1 (2Fe-2S)-binding protein [Romboutsia sp. 1001216sp1]MDB8798571.1 (2Fe-2S)-binding protein [Romboutsia sp. 1001216sp1]MDB8800716.1 (2Fe-2S)-binding protein [Romboutsia sp. 1001216sp1]
MSENIICLCKSISEEAIVKAIKEGATSIEAVKEKTEATTGPCKGSRCISKIEELIEKHK